MTPREISLRLSERAESVAMHLLPNGRRSGSEWQVGSVGGEKGQSLNVHIGSGAKAGRWSDFAEGSSGDLIDLWQQVRGCDIKTAMQEAKDFLGIKEVSLYQPKKKSFQEPEKPKGLKVVKQQSPVMHYLAKRGFTPETIKAFKLGEAGGSLILPFVREDGTPVLLKNFAITPDGLEIARNENGKRRIWASKNSQPCLFGWQTIPGNARSVTITEGEFDAMAGWQMGKACLSVPFGGGIGEKQDWIEYEFDNLARFDRIYLALDNDDEGQKAAEFIAKRLGLERCYLVTLPYKDLNECLDNGAFEEVEEAYLRARTKDPDLLVSALDERDEMHSAFDETPATMGMTLPWEIHNDKIRFRPCESTIWTGYSGHGKSELLGFIALWGIKQGYRFCIASFEMPTKITLARMIRQAAKILSPTRGYRDAIMDELGPGLWFYKKIGQASIDEVLEAFRYSAKRYGVNQFIIDSLVKLGIGEEDYDGQKNAVDKITSFCHEFSVHVHLVAHPRKGFDEDRPPRKLDVKGGGAITDQVDNVCIAWRNKPKERERKKIESGEITEEEATGQNKGDTFFFVDKQRANGKECMIHLYHDPSGVITASEGWRMPDYCKYTGERLEVK